MSSTTDEPSERTLTAIGVGSALMQIVAFTAVGVVTLESVPYGVAVGGLSGAGAFLFLPWFLSLSAATEGGEAGLGQAAKRIDRAAGPGLFGLGLELGAIAALALGFVRGPDLLLGLPAALAVAVGVYLAGSALLGR
ncbi:hypothetical protein [Halolamina sp. C58]|uniref:hypothetical protein n=1 Tax=Halolamina sp. C58 TaxID=3421640 RepID=UPI003EBEAD34